MASSRLALPEDLPLNGITPDTYRATRIYETILATTDDFAYIFDPQGRFLYANARLLKVWAKTLDEVVGKTCHELGYPTWHADMHMREIEEIVRTKRAIRNEVPFTGASGISGIYDYIFQPFLDESGNVEVIVGTTRDVTERKRNEEQLKSMQVELQARAEELGESAAKFRSLFDQSAFLISILDVEGTLLETNSLSLEGCGYRADQVTGKPFWECGWWSGSAEAQQKVRAGIQEAAEGHRHLATLNYYLADGTERVIDMAFNPIRNEDGKVILLSPSGFDVTEHHRAQAQAEFLSHLTQRLSTVSDSFELNRIAVRAIGQYLKAHRVYFFNAYPDIHHARVWQDWCREEGPSIEGIYTLAEYGAPEWWAAVRTGPVSVDDVAVHPLTKTPSRPRPVSPSQPCFFWISNCLIKTDLKFCRGFAASLPWIPSLLSSSRLHPKSAISKRRTDWEPIPF